MRQRFATAGSQQLPNPAGYVALTFDDGPDPELTPQLLDVLQVYNAPATFFVEGANVHAYPEIVEREADEEHRRQPLLRPREPAQPERRAGLAPDPGDDRGAGGDRHRAGAVPPAVRRPRRPHRRHRRGGGLTLTLWSYSADPRDWDTPDGEGKPAAEVCETVVETARAGDLILLHDRLAGTVQAVPCIIRGLRERRLEPGRVVRSC